VVRSRDWPLRGKITALVIAASAVPLLLAGAIALHQVRESARADAGALLGARADQLVGELDAFHTAYLQSAARLARFPAVESACAGDDGRADGANLAAVLRAYLTTDANLFGIAVVAADGEVPAATPAAPRQEPSSQWIRAALQGGDAAVSGLFVPRGHDGEPLLSYAAPLACDGGRPARALVLHVRAGAFWNAVRRGDGRAGEGSYSVVYEPSGIRVAHSSAQDLVFRPAGPLDPAVLEAAVAEARFGPRTRELLGAPVSAPSELERARAERVDPGPFQGGPEPVPASLGVARRLSTVPWTLFYRVPEASVYAPARQLVRSLAVAVAIVLLGALALGLAATQRLVRPLRRLAAASEAIARGDLGARVAAPATGGDELGLLARRFNHMAEAVQAARAELEASVRDRTAAAAAEHEARAHAEAARGFALELIERITDGFVALDPGWRYTYVNRRAAELFGRRPEDLVGKHIWTEFPEGVGQPFHLAYERAMREQVALTIEEHYAPWDRWFENRIYPSPNGISIYFQEITGRKRGEAALRASGERLRALAARLQTAREEEKTRIARDLHDDLGQLLTGLKLDLRSIERAAGALGPPEAARALRERLASACACVDDTVASVQRIAADLRPSALDRLGLGAALQAEARRFEERSGTACEVRLDGSASGLDDGRAIALYRIAQEALTNVARHAGASRVTIALGQEPGGVTLRIEDDGRGLDEAATRSGALGLLGMEERAVAFGGTVTVTRGPERGTVVRASLPLPRSVPARPA
jgi:PAS domain S-box-containing protein